MSDTGQKKLSLNPRVRFREVADEGVIVQMDSGRVLVVNSVGIFLLPLMKTPVSREDLVTALVSEFDVTSEQAADDLDTFLAQLDQEQIILRS